MLIYENRHLLDDCVKVLLGIKSNN